MTSWEIVRDVLIAKEKKSTVGMDMQLNIASDVFFSLMEKINDREDAITAYNADNEMRGALLSRPVYERLRKEGVIK